MRNLNNLDKDILVERSLLTTYKNKIYSKFIKALKEYSLISKNDHIAVCISGGKDSFLLAKCLQLLQKHSDVPFKLEYVLMDPGFNIETLNKILTNSKLLNIPLQVFKTDIFKIVNLKNSNSPCFLCARMRRGALYNIAEKISCNKIALGHHFDDVIETTMLSILYSGQYQTMLPKLHSDNYQHLELIRPLFFVKEHDIINFVNYNNLSFDNCNCTLTNKKTDSKRQEVKELIATLRKKDKNIDNNIFKSMYNVNIDTIIAYKKDNKIYNYLDNYSKDNLPKP